MMRRFSLATKLALLLSALSLGLVLAILLAFKTSFDRDFDHYINEVVAERMEGLALHLAQQPEEFAKLLHSHRHWERFLRHYLRDPGGNIEEPVGEGTPGRDGQPNSEPRRNHERGRDQEMGRYRESWRGERGEGPPSRELARWGVVRRSVWLLDASGKFTGREPLPPVEQLRLIPIEVDNKSLGFLAWRPIKPRDSKVDAHFAERQHRLFGWIAFFAVLVSCLLAWPLSRYLVNPVRRLSLAMGALMQRDYARRVPVVSGDELGDLARDFNVMAQTLEEQDRQQRQWLADISHELRTPLGVMKGELEAVEDGILALDHVRVRSLGEEVNQLTRLVDDLHQLAITQVSHLRYEWQTIELTQFIQKMSLRLMPMLQQARLTWTLDVPEQPLWIRADSQRLEQLVMNLLQNSIRYTDRGGAVRVTVKVGINPGATSVSLCWEDSAPGVDEDDLAHLFERFYRVEHSRQRALGGSGLGLAIVANIAEAHGASIHAETSPLGGLKITLGFNVVDKK